MPEKLRLRFEKTGRAIYISHLDLMRTMQRVFLRADCPLKYSEGFNPHALISILLPLSKAIIAVIALYVAVAHWNNYYNALVYTTNTKLHPLQLYLRQLLLVTMNTDSVDDPDALKEIQDMILTIRYAVIVISTLPIMCLYPFLQKYFVQGVMIGSLKG